MKVLGKEDQRGKDMGHNIIKIPLRGRFTGQCAAKWYARISKHGKTINLGFFDTKKEAIVARRAAEITYYGYNLNIEARYGD